MKAEGGKMKFSLQEKTDHDTWDNLDDFLKVVEMKSCMGCAFASSFTNCGCQSYYCLRGYRNDGKDVGFSRSSLKEYIKYKRIKK